MEFFSFGNFKKWLADQAPEPLEENLVGCVVEPAVGLRKLMLKMEVEDDETYQLAKEFRRNGGVVTDSDGQNLMIEVAGGAFALHRNHVKTRGEA